MKARHPHEQNFASESPSGQESGSQTTASGMEAESALPSSGEGSPVAGTVLVPCVDISWNSHMACGDTPVAFPCSKEENEAAETV